MGEDHLSGSGSVDTLVIGGDTTAIDLNGYGAQSVYSIDAITNTISIDPSILTSTLTTGAVGSSSTAWTTNYSYSTYATSPSVKIGSDGVDMDAGCDIKIGGKSLMEAIAAIEDRLAILKPNAELEDRWEQLKELRRQYEALEKDILEKEKIMRILKEK